MESIESVDVLPNADNDTNETVSKTVENTEIVNKSDLEKCIGADRCLVMAIDTNVDNQPPGDGTVVLDGVQNAVATESIMSESILLATVRSSDADARNICDSDKVETEQGDANVIQMKEHVEVLTSLENQQNKSLEMETVGNVAHVAQISNGKFTSKSDNVSVAKPVGSLGLLVQYVSSSDDEDDESSGDSGNVDAQAKDLIDKVMSKGSYRVADDDEDSDETGSDNDDSDVECVVEVIPETIDITNEADLKAFMDSCDDNGAPKAPVKAKGEFGLDDLPPIADLTITVPASECTQLGRISGVVETLVLVESLPNFAAVDLDTVLFLDKGNRTLGQVFDVMGNVASPIYCVRFNKAQDIVDKKITIDEIVYVAPKTEHTNFIVLSELMNQKGTDASWEDDIEPPTGSGDFSDDEEERVARRSRNQQQRNRNRMSTASNDIDDGPLPSKVTVKQESFFGSKQRDGNRHTNINNRNHRNRDNPPIRAHQFYKDNRGYANTPSNYTNFHQTRLPMQYDHSWHTAGMIHPPLPSVSASAAMSAGMQMPMPQGCYPNPFAMASNPMNYGYFNLQAFPPLPPPICVQPPPPIHSQRNTHFNHNNTFNERSGPHPDK